MSCPTCQKAAAASAAPRVAVTAYAVPAVLPQAPRGLAEPRTGACLACLRKHLLKAEGYAEEIAEDPTREWESSQLLKNLMLAEDHARALALPDFARAVRAARLAFEERADLAPALALLASAPSTSQTPSPAQPA